LSRGAFDVLHFHNISLIGGPRLLSLAAGHPGTIKLMTAHEHWLTCPLSLLWKFNREICERPQCIRCTLAAGRPPQLWRSTGVLSNAVRHLDALLVPSRHAAEVHRARGIEAPLRVLPYFLPDDWADSRLGREFGGTRPYVAAAGRLITEKGFHRLIPLMARLPDVDLLIAGVGPMKDSLQQLARGLPNVCFLGLLGFPDLARLFRGARALIVPSLFYETFGYVVLEALSMGTPAIVHRRGALPELLEMSGGGIIYDTDRDLVAAIRQLVDDTALGGALGERGAKAVRTIWSEERVMSEYCALIESLRTHGRHTPSIPLASQ
jgi:glycosyltransferase involved in cell wall biosynthesis